MELPPARLARFRVDAESTSNLLTPRRHAKKSKYEYFKSYVYVFLERPQNKVATVYHITNLLLIIGSIGLSVLSTVEFFESDTKLRAAVFYCEIGLLTMFSTEYALRIWACSFVSKYSGIRGRLLFMRTFYMLVDAFVIASTLATAVLHVKTSYFSMLRITRFLQVFRILRMDRQRGDIRTMSRVVYQHRKELITCYFVGFIILFAGTYIVYICEKQDATASITNMVDGLYWGMITVTSVGYGDLSPKTWAGKAITGVFALVGGAFFGLPAGVLGAGFALQVSKQKKQKRYIKVRNPAAIAIQNCWRNFTVRREMPNLQATWESFFPHENFKHNHPSYYEYLPGIRSNGKHLREDQHMSARGNASNGLDVAKSRIVRTRSSSILNRFDFKRDTPFPRVVNLTSNMISLNIDPMDPTVCEKFALTCSSDCAESGRRKASLSFSDSEKEKKKSGTCPTEILISNLLNAKFKAAIRFILRVKYWTSVRNFKNIRYPFVNVQDIMEKNSQNHAETMLHLRDLSEHMTELRRELLKMRSVAAGQSLNDDAAQMDNFRLAATNSKEYDSGSDKHALFAIPMKTVFEESIDSKL